jgi:hypothetical protein
VKSIDPSLVRSRFSYDKDNGVLTRIACSQKCLIGKAAGTLNNGYLKTYIGSVPYSVHRLIWVMVTGAWPDGCIDHIDGNGRNNRWANLRDVSQKANTQNRRRACSSNRCGFLGVSDLGRNLKKPFRALIQTGKRRVFLGMFSTAEEAHSAYLVAKRVFHEGCTL